MSIQRAEDLKREWTDRFVKVQDGVPELRRFEGLVGTVKTVNMNCRLLIEFDTPADISWYDIDPLFVVAVDPDEAKTISAASKTKDASPEKPAAKAAASSPSGKKTAAAGGSPLDAIRASGGGGGSASAKPAAGGSPLDAIRASGGGSAPAKPAAGGSPLDAIRASGGGGSSAPAKPAAGGSPLDAIRASSGGSAAGTPVAGGSPLDAIRANASGAGEASSPDAAKATTEGASASDGSTANAVEVNSAGSSTDNDLSESESESESAGAGLNVASAAAASGSGGGAAAAINAVGAAAAANGGDSNTDDFSESTSGAGTDSSSSTSADSQPAAFMNTAASSETGTLSGERNSDELSALDQVRAQASAQPTTGTGGKQQTLFDQVRQQAASDNADPNDTDIADKSAAGVEDPVKQTFKGKKLPKLDDLKIIEGIGPKIEQLMNADGINTWMQLSTADTARLKKVLEAAGPRFRMHNPETWPKQAELANDGQWQELEQYQDHLDGGRPPE